MNIGKITSGYASTNTYFISQDKQMVVVDPCLEVNNNAQKLLAEIEGYDVLGIIITHGHFDHISGIDAIVEKTNCKVYVHHKECEWLKNPKLNLSTMIPEIVSIKAKLEGIDCGELVIGPFHFDVIKTSGHTSNSISYILGEAVFDGDFIFENSIGRMDLPTGSQVMMISSIKSFIEEYKDRDFTLYPGHGNVTTLQSELLSNPFMGIPNNLGSA